MRSDATLDKMIEDQFQRRLDAVKAEPAAGNGLAEDMLLSIKAMHTRLREAAAPSPPVSVEQAGKATAEQIEAGIREYWRVTRDTTLPNADCIAAAINAALQLAPAHAQ